MGTVDVLFGGKIKPGTDVDQVAEKLSQLTGVGNQQAADLVSSGNMTVVKRGLSQEQGEKYVQAFTAIGIEASLRPSAQKAVSTPKPPPVAKPPSPTESRQDDAEQSVPSLSTLTKSQLEMEKPPTEETTATGTQSGESSYTTTTEVPRKEKNEVPQGPIESIRKERGGFQETAPSYELEWNDDARTVPASHGYLWIKRAWNLFMEEPGVWAAAFFFMIVCSGIVKFIPYGVGTFVSALLSTLFAGAVAQMAHKQANGEGISWSDFFQALQHKPAQLLILGVLIILYVAVIMFILLAIVGPNAFTSLAQGPAANPDFAKLSGTFFFAMVVGFILAIPILCASPFAAALVSLTDDSPLAALRKGMFAGLKNWLAFLVYSIALMIISMVLGLIVGLFAGLLHILGIPALLNAIIFVILALVLALPVYGTMILLPYVMTRDIFYSEP